jgi:hypothetical protein
MIKDVIADHFSGNPRAGAVPPIRLAGYTSKWIRPHSLTLADSSGLISPDETDLFRAVAQAVTDGLAVIRPVCL